jgi:cold shock CspA family protein
MARPQETFNTKEQEKLRAKKRKEKQEKKEARKSNPKLSGEDLYVYVDENGNLSSTPPDPKKKGVVMAHDIQLGIPRRTEEEEGDGTSQGVVTFFNESKGYGFIKDSDTGNSIFVHAKETAEPIREGDKVIFETESTPRGPGAVRVRKA